MQWKLRKYVRCRIVRLVRKYFGSWFVLFEFLRVKMHSWRMFLKNYGEYSLSQMCDYTRMNGFRVGLKHNRLCCQLLQTSADVFCSSIILICSLPYPIINYFSGKVMIVDLNRSCCQFFRSYFKYWCLVSSALYLLAR